MHSTLAISRESGILEDMENNTDHEIPCNECVAARLVGWAVTTLRSARCRGKGPPYRKVGSRVLYLPSEVIAWRDRDVRRPATEGA
jgi:hypothetical protein